MSGTSIWCSPYSNLLQIPTCQGQPTNVPPNLSGFAAVLFDTVNLTLWIYNQGTSTWEALPSVLSATGIGTISQSAFNTVVTHGLGILPTLGQITLTASAIIGSGGLWVSNITTTTFQININTALGYALNVGWAVTLYKGV